MAKNTWVYVWIRDIPGRVREKGYARWIEAHSLEFAVSARNRPRYGGEAGEASERRLSQVLVSLTPGEASVRLASALASGRILEKVKIDFLVEARRGKRRVLTYELGSVIVASYHPIWTPATNARVQEVGLAYGTIKSTVLGPVAPGFDAGWKVQHKTGRPR